MATHQAVATTARGELQLIDAPTPTPGPDEVLVDAHYAALIPFDGYQLNFGYALQPEDYPRVLGFAGAGVVRAVGSEVKDLKTGDRVATFNFPESKNKAAQEVYVVPRHQVAAIPDSFPLDQAAALPDNFTTAIYTLFSSATLALPIPPHLSAPSPPTRPAVDTTLPILINGAGSSAGHYLLQALRLAGYTNLLCTASPSHHAHLLTLGATACVDYTSPSAAADLAAHGRPQLAIDIVASRSSLTLLSGVFAASPGGEAKLAVLAPFKDGARVTNAEDSAMHFVAPDWVKELFPAELGVQVVPVYTFRLGEDEVLRGWAMPVLLPELLRRGEVVPNKVRLVSEETLLERVREGVGLFKDEKVRGEKVVVKIK